MSATGRGSERIAADNYPTPGWCVRRLLEAVELPSGYWLEPCAGEGAIVDVLRERQWGGAWGCNELWACELRPECEERLKSKADRVLIHDFTDVDGWPMISAAISNPPFGIAERIIKTALALPGSPVVAMLLRLNFLEGQARADWLRVQPPDVYVLPERPSFAHKVSCAHEVTGRTGDGDAVMAMRGCGWQELIPHTDLIHLAECPKCDGPTRRSAATDSIGYGWFVWPAERERACGSVRVLASTPKEERRAA